MRSATVKQAVATNADRVKPGSDVPAWRRAPSIRRRPPKPCSSTVTPRLRCVGPPSKSPGWWGSWRSWPPSWCTSVGPPSRRSLRPGLFGLAPGHRLTFVMVLAAVHRTVLALLIVLKRLAPGSDGRHAAHERGAPLHARGRARSTSRSDCRPMIGSRVHWLRAGGRRLADRGLASLSSMTLEPMHRGESPGRTPTPDRQAGNDVGAGSGSIPDTTILFHRRHAHGHRDPRCDR